MCSSPKVDNSIQKKQLQEAEEARKREEERQARIKAGTAKIDQTFEAFDDGFYNNLLNDYTSFYMPQLDDQFGKAKDDLTFALARAGTINSTVAADKQADLLKQYDTQRASILSQGQDTVNAQRQRIGSEKSALVAQLNATGDADRASNEALARTQQMYHEKPAYNPLGDIFAGAAAGVGNYWNAQQNANAVRAYYGAANGNRAGSGRII